MFICGFEESLTSLTLVLSLLPDTVVLARCPKGWTGPGCNHQCFCANNDCDEDVETCRLGDFCKKDFFGAACQYTNVVSLSNGTSGDLFDQDDSTCIIVEDGQVTLEFDRELRFTFMRLVLLDMVNLNSVDISFTHKDSSTSQCKNYTYLYYSPTTLDIHCQMGGLYTTMTITWSGDVTVCGIYVSGGRKLYAPAINSSSANGDRNQFGMINDGLTASCFLPDTNDVRTYLNVHYNDHVVFQRVSIVGCLDCIVNVGGRDYTTLVASYSVLDFFEWSVKDEKVPPVIRVTFLSNNPVGKLCEIVAYGDCQPGYTGLDCSERCTSQCPRNVCNLIDDRCASCPLHTYGTDCEKMADDLNQNTKNETTEGHSQIDEERPSYDGDPWVKIWFVFIVLFFILVTGMMLCLLYLCRARPTGSRNTLQEKFP